MYKNMMKQPVYQHYSEMSFEEGKSIRELEQTIEEKTKQLWNQAIIENLIKWKDLLAADSTWEDDAFIHMHPWLPKHWGQHLSEGEGHVKP